MTFEEIWPIAKNIDGWFSEENARALYDHARMARTGIVEIGVYRGRSSAVLLAAASVPVTLIDNWKWSPDRETDMQGYEEAKATLAPLGTFTMLCLDSEAALSRVPPFDFIHIDALHNMGQPEKDCSLWMPALQSGGIACFHDYGTGMDEVTAAVDKHTYGWENLGVFDSLAIRRKP